MNKYTETMMKVTMANWEGCLLHHTPDAWGNMSILLKAYAHLAYHTGNEEFAEDLAWLNDVAIEHFNLSVSQQSSAVRSVLKEVLVSIRDRNSPSDERLH